MSSRQRNAARTTRRRSSNREAMDPMFQDMIMCNTMVVESDSGRRLCAALFSRLVCGVDRSPASQDTWPTVRVYNELCLPRPFQKFRVTDLNGLWIRDDELVFAMRFREPANQVLVRIREDYISMARGYIARVRSMMDGKSESTSGTADAAQLDPDYMPSSLELYVTPTVFNQRRVDLSCVSVLVLEKCSVPRLTIGPARVTYVSLADSVLGVDGVSERFFDWMTSDTVFGSLRALKLDGCGLKVLPYELVYLRTIITLSVARNKLEVLPHYLGELNTMKNLYANDNVLKFLPGSLKEMTFLNLDVSNNDFFAFEPKNEISSLKRNELRSINNRLCPSLVDISFHYLFNSCIIKRQHLPRSLWSLFDELKRCSICEQLVLTDCFEVYKWGLAKTLNLSHNSDILWQMFECKHQCKSALMLLNLNLYTDDRPHLTLRQKLQEKPIISGRLPVECQWFRKQKFTYKNVFD